LSVKLIFININIELKQQLLNSARKSIEKAGMMTTSNKVYEPFWKVAKLLLACKGESKMVKNETVIKLINDKKISLLLRNSNVFSYNQATNEIGFSALPGGYRFALGSFLALHQDCNFWSSTQQSSTTANMRYLENGSAELKSYVDDKKAGTSIRVVKD
jgi:uncharacterized protein (TIGR02145 family)